jgi:hypothetical protein
VLQKWKYLDRGCSCNSYDFARTGKRGMLNKKEFPSAPVVLGTKYSFLLNAVKLYMPDISPVGLILKV